MPLLRIGSQERLRDYTPEWGKSYLLDPDSDKMRGFIRDACRRHSVNDTQIEEKDLEALEAALGGLVDRVLDKCDEVKGKMYQIQLSHGGSKKDMGKNGDGTGAKSVTSYLKAEINGIVILEAVGQYGNATIIAKASDELDGELERLTRDEIKSTDFATRIIHDHKGGNTKNGEYNYENNHMLVIMDAAHKKPEELIKLMENPDKTGVKIDKLVKMLEPAEDKELTPLGMLRDARGQKDAEYKEHHRNRPSLTEIMARNESIIDPKI
ncbi:MAG: hypothetical protein LBL34_04345 [Clostridiales bacterium]|jgi:hypothetical protein|nr:hypothetical protein [Clostridiales bacterium]